MLLEQGLEPSPCFKSSYLPLHSFKDLEKLFNKRNRYRFATFYGVVSISSLYRFGMQIDEFSSIVFRLTNAAIDLSPDAYQAAQIEIMRDVFHFDAAWWGWSNLSGGRDHLINTGLYGLPNNFEGAVRSVLHLDPFVQTGRKLTVFGKAVDVESAVLPDDYKHCLGSFNITSILNGHCRLQGDTEFNFFLSLYGRDKSKKFTRADANDFRAIIKHIEQNLSLSLKTELRSLAPSNGEAAFVSLGGAIVRATSGFKTKLQATNLKESGIRKLLKDMSLGRRQWNHANWVVDSAPYKTGLFLIKVYQSESLSRLSSQERRVADLLSTGLTMRQIAEHNSVSHNTIRNQVSAIYRKTGAANRAMLVKKLSDE